jgi:2Fe-2S ferredoxin
MPKVLFADSKKTADIRVGETILKAAQKGRVALNQRCGGNGSCTTCKINVNENELKNISLPNQIEKRMISGEALHKGERLGCQVKVYSNVTVSIVENPLKAIIRAKLEEGKHM